MALRADTILLLCGAALVTPTVALADGERFDPYAKVAPGRYSYDMEEILRRPDQFVAAPVEQPDLAKLNEPKPIAAAPLPPGQLPEGWVQLGEVVQREEIAKGLKQVDPEPSAAWEDIEGNQYPRKGTVFLNFNGGQLKIGDDNSAESKSTLARHNHNYPVFNGSEATALTLIQAVQEDMAKIGVRVVYLARPHKTVPYTMAMVGGSWTDTNISDPAGGVAPGTDCEDRDQRNVVYAFDGQSATVSQEIAHAWGLDHTIGSDRIMSYQGGFNKFFGDNCQPLCEEGCQGPGSIGCRLIHEVYCGVDSEAQNDLAELNKIFGDTTPDMEPPVVEIVEPKEDVVKVAVGSTVSVGGRVSDNYGGVGWKLTVVKDGMVAFDQVDYDRKLGWDFTNLPAGTYEVVLEAEDHADHVVTDKMTIIVGDEAPPDPVTTTDDPTTGGEGSGGSSGDDPATAGETDGTAKDGCECSAGGGGPGGLLGLPLMGLWGLLRARSRARRAARV
jgi:hypothetical protein